MAQNHSDIAVTYIYWIHLLLLERKILERKMLLNASVKANSNLIGKWKLCVLHMCILIQRTEIYTNYKLYCFLD